MLALSGFRMENTEWMKMCTGFLLRDKNVKLDCTDDCTTMWIYSKPLICMLSMGELFSIWNVWAV